MAGPDSSLLRERVVEVSNQKRLNIILNLKRVEFIDSTGLGTMVMSFTTIQKLGGALKLLNLSETPYRVAGLDEVVDHLRGV